MTLDSTGVDAAPSGADQPALAPAGHADDDTDPFGFPPVGTVYRASSVASLTELLESGSVPTVPTTGSVPTTGNGFDLAWPLAGATPPPEDSPTPRPEDSPTPRPEDSPTPPPEDSPIVPPAVTRTLPPDNREVSPPVNQWPPPPDEHRTGRRMKWAVVAAVVFAAAMVAAILLVPRSDNRLGATGGTTGAGGSGGTSLAGPVAGRTAAVFDLIDGVDSVRVRAGDLGDDLYRISATGGGVKPRVDSDDAGIRLSLSARTGPAAVDVVLNTAVRWTMRLHGGVKNADLDLTGAVVDAVDLAGGASRIDLTLPEPRDLMPVRMTGGVDQFRVRLAGATPVRVRVQSGAGQVTLAGTTHQGIAPGASFTAYGWGSGSAGIDLEAVAGMSALTVTGG